MSLSAEQAAVTESLNNHNLVLALPGAGKTHTMISFISNLVQNQNNKVIALTFTNAAAEEMRARVGKLVHGQKRKQIFVSTFHALIWQQTKKHPKFNGRMLLTGSSHQRVIAFIIENYRNKFNIAEQHKFESEITHSEDGSELEKPKKESVTYSFLNVCQKLIKLYSETPFHEDVEFEFSKVFEIGGVNHFYNYYLQKLDELKYWPLDTMCVEVTRALIVGDIEPINCTQIIVDEFQDTDLVQYSWVKSHGLAGAKITVVGDDDQSIFSFRGALGVHGMRMFKNDFNVITHTLSMCFRCGSEILSSAGEVIKRNSDRINKVMNSGSQIEGEVFLLKSSDQEQELEQITNVIMNNAGQSIAVLARTNQELNDLEKHLNSEANIEVNRINSKSIWENDHLKILMHFFCTITQLNPHNHLIPLLVFLQESQSNIVQIKASLGGAGFGHCNINEWDLNANTILLNQVCQQQWHLADCSDKEKVMALIQFVITSFSDILTERTQKFQDVFEEILWSMPGATLLEKLKCIEDFSNQIKRRDKTDELPVLTTLHGSKGLEWDVVCLMGVSADNIPHTMPGVTITPALTEEERRLLYVGMTRAKSKLYLSWFGEQSRFIEQAFGIEVFENL